MSTTIAIPAPRGMKKRLPAPASAATSMPLPKQRSYAAHHHHHANSSTNKKDKSLSQKELSVVVMLLAAETAVCSMTSGSAAEGISAASAASLPGWASRLRASAFPSGAVTLDKPTIEAARAAFAADPPKKTSENSNNKKASTTAVVFDGLNESVRRVVCSFLGWRDCAVVRQASSTWRAASRETLLVGVLPSQPTVPAVFLPCPVALDGADPHRLEQRLRCCHPGKWRCTLCGFLNTETRILCGNRGCQTPCPSHQHCARLFVGQLRREGTVPMLKWLVEGVIGHAGAPVRIRNVENHRDQHTGRGKGCAWIYTEAFDMAQQVLLFHHRTFADVHPEIRREGVWIVPNTSECVAKLASDVERRAGGNAPRSQLLPRCPLVVEFPALQQQQQLQLELQQQQQQQQQHYYAPAPYQQQPYYAPTGAYTATAPAPPSYAATAQSLATPARSTPDAYAATDSPPSEESDLRPSSSNGAAPPAIDGESDSQAPPVGARWNTPPTPTGSVRSSTAGAKRRHEPYRTSPTMVGAPSFAATSPMMMPSNASTAPCGYMDEFGAYSSGDAYASYTSAGVGYGRRYQNMPWQHYATAQ